MLEESPAADTVRSQAVETEAALRAATVGLCAKPIVDIQLLVDDSGDELSYADALIGVGYTLRIREPEWDEHRLFKGSDPAWPTLCARDSRQAERTRRFRDALRASDAERDRYATVKRELSTQSWAYVQQYADAKNTVIDEILARAGNTIPRL